MLASNRFGLEHKHAIVPLRVLLPSDTPARQSHCKMAYLHCSCKRPSMVWCMHVNLMHKDGTEAVVAGALLQRHLVIVVLAKQLRHSVSCFTALTILQHLLYHIRLMHAVIAPNVAHQMLLSAMACIITSPKWCRQGMLRFTRLSPANLGDINLAGSKGCMAHISLGTLVPYCEQMCDTASLELGWGAQVPHIVWAVAGVGPLHLHSLVPFCRAGAVARRVPAGTQPVRAGHCTAPVGCARSPVEGNACSTC